MKYQEWKASERVGVSPGRENLNSGADHDVDESHVGNLADRTMSEPDGIFSPPCTSTPRLEKYQGNSKQQQRGDRMAFGEKVNLVRSFSSRMCKFWLKCT